VYDSYDEINIETHSLGVKWKHSHCTPNRAESNRTGPSLTEQVPWWVSVFTRQLTTDYVAQHC